MYVVTGPVNSCIDHVSPGDFRFLFTNGVYVLTGLVITREDLYIAFFLLSYIHSFLGKESYIHSFLLLSLRMERYKYIITRDLVYIEKYRPVIKTSASPRFLYWSIFLVIAFLVFDPTNFPDT